MKSQLCFAMLLLTVTHMESWKAIRKNLHDSLRHAKNEHIQDARWCGQRLALANHNKLATGTPPKVRNICILGI